MFKYHYAIIINMNDNKQLKRAVVIALIGLLLVGNVYFMVKDLRDNKIDVSSGSIKLTSQGDKVLSFLKLFIEKILKAEGEVSFEDRLQLENSVRALNDDEVFGQWEKFVNSVTNEEAQDNVRDLLELLVNRISPN